MPDTDQTAPDAPLTSYLDSFTNESYRQRVGTLGMLRLLEPTRTALHAYERELVASARGEGRSWEEIGDALGVPKQTAHRRWSHVG
jgi:DNA-directed RNA polymerase specialized sigma24 family protein